MMKKYVQSLFVGIFLSAALLNSQAAAGGPYPGQTHPDQRMARHAARVPWHAAYYHQLWNQPLALVVPPTANMQSHFAWGVTGTRMTPTYHQFARPYPGDQGPGGPYLPTPNWPSDTGQSGVYYIRAPW